MPTTTFLNLPKKKQDIIIEASIKEFNRVLLKDASINKIIKDAKISRGSFYNYFEDINDLYIYTLNSYKKNIFEIFKTTIENKKGNLIESTKEIFKKIIYCTKIEKNIFKNIFLNMNYNTSIKTTIESENINDKYEMIELISKIDKRNLNIKTDEELLYIIEMISDFVMHGLIDTFLENKQEQETIEKLEKQLEILAKGIYKED